MRRIALLAVIAFAAALSAFPQTAPAPKHHTVFQMSDGEAEWSPLIAHVNNLRNALDKDGGVAVEVVFFGDGINMLLKSGKFTEGLKLLSDRGVILAACQNSMRTRNIKTEDMVPFAIQVESGVAELTKKQESGWAYIR